MKNIWAALALAASINTSWTSDIQQNPILQFPERYRWDAERILETHRSDIDAAVLEFQDIRSAMREWDYSALISTEDETRLREGYADLSTQVDNFDFWAFRDEVKWQVENILMESVGKWEHTLNFWNTWSTQLTFWNNLFAEYSSWSVTGVRAWGIDVDDGRVKAALQARLDMQHFRVGKKFPWVLGWDLALGVGISKLQLWVNGEISANHPLFSNEFHESMAAEKEWYEPHLYARWDAERGIVYGILEGRLWLMTWQANAEFGVDVPVSNSGDWNVNLWVGVNAFWINNLSDSSGLRVADDVLWGTEPYATAWISWKGSNPLLGENSLNVWVKSNGEDHAVSFSRKINF